MERGFDEKASARRWIHPQLHRALSQLRPGDVFVICKLDRLSCFLNDLLTLMERMSDIEEGFL